MNKKNMALSLVLGVIFALPALAGPPRTIETVNVTEGVMNVGAAALVRENQSATFRINTTMLDPDSAYTVWVAAFNHPENCVDGCNGPDLPAADGSVFFGSAFVTGSSGTANVEFTVLANNLPAGTFIAGGHDKGIKSGKGHRVELHLIIAQHGPSILIDDWPGPLSTPGPAEQVAMFIP